MRSLLTYLISIYSVLAFGQQVEPKNTTSSIFISPEIFVGITGESNENFPERKLQKGLLINLSWDHTYNGQEWSSRLKKLRTGVGIGYTNFGNKDSLGNAFSLMPFIEFNAFKKKKLKIQIGTGISYLNKKYDSLTNPNNKAISTNLAWSFRLSTYYHIFNSKPITWKIGASYFHHSNGHSRLPNQGFNSFLLSLATDIAMNKHTYEESNIYSKKKLEKQRNYYFSIRTGYGINTLSRSFNEKKDVYTISAEYGKIFNRVLKLGFGFYYRYYENYYDYITNNQSLVQPNREFNYLTKKPVWNASNIGLSLNGELLLNHVGIDLQFGINLHKPAYQIDWRINQGWEYVPQVIPEDSGIVLGEFTTYYTLKHRISSRFGLKYYLKGTDKPQKTNFYIGAFINANLGQADFNEIGVGYIHEFSFN